MNNDFIELTLIHQIDSGKVMINVDHITSIHVHTTPEKEQITNVTIMGNRVIAVEESYGEIRDWIQPSQTIEEGDESL
jgi:hypothetical protein